MLKYFRIERTREKDTTWNEIFEVQSDKRISQTDTVSESYTRTEIGHVLDHIVYRIVRDTFIARFHGESNRWELWLLLARRKILPPQI